MVAKEEKDFINRLQDDIYFKFRKAQVISNWTDRAGTLHVSDVKSECMRNVYYSKKDPNPSMTTEQFRPLWLGQAIHGFSQIAEKDLHEVTLAWDYVHDEVVDLEKWKKEVPLTDPRWYDVLIGSIDDIVEYDGQMVIVDKKTTGSIDYFKRSSSPSETHTIQLNHYRVLLQKCKGMDVSWGAIVYISTKQTAGKMDAPICIATPLDSIENTIKSIKKNGAIVKDSMLNGVIPPRVKNFLCDGYCSYATMCFTDERTHE